MRIFLAQEFHDITGPVDYFLLKPWMIFCAVAATLLVIGLTIWLIKWWRNRPVIVPTPRERALDLLARIETEIDKLTPYKFSISMLAATSFSGDEQSLLTDFLNRCDLIKFARYDATREDSRLLLNEANRFVKGGVLEPA